MFHTQKSRGESTKGYSLQFRHIEFSNALSTIRNADGDDRYQTTPIQFKDALTFDGEDEFSEMSDNDVETFGGSMQYVTINNDDTSNEENDDKTTLSTDATTLSNELLIQTTKRCALVRSTCEIIAEGDTYEDLANIALSNGSLADYMVDGINFKDSWCVRLRQYGARSTSNRQKRYGTQMKSPLTLERYAVDQMDCLFDEFGGKVQLENPDCALYILEGLNGRQKILARLLARGPEIIRVMAPNTRICITKTPLCPIAAYALCNLARIKNGDKVLDPYAGSCATLLASAMLAPECVTVGIEIAHDGIVDRKDVRRDFLERGLILPAKLICGDSTSKQIRLLARNAIGGSAFDAIITDPPYGIREKNKAEYCIDPPLIQLVKAIALDRQDGHRLLKKGGRLVAFVPNKVGEKLSDGLPNQDDLKKGGLLLTEMREQPLSGVLSRWLVVYVCVK